MHVHFADSDLDRHKVCPQCRMKITSRRALRHDDIFDAIIERLFPDIEVKSRKIVLLHKFHQKFEQQRTANLVESSKRYSSSQTPGEMSEAPPKPRRGRPPRHQSTTSDQASPADLQSESVTSPVSSSSEQMSSPSEDDTEGEDDTKEIRRGRQNASVTNRSSRRPITPKDADYYSDGMCLEVFLVCLNQNLPAPVCSMARELSKRVGFAVPILTFNVLLEQPMKVPFHATTRDVGLLLAERLIQDVLGSYDVASILTDLSFVREVSTLCPKANSLYFRVQHEVWAALSNALVVDICRQVTESRGPIALRYVLADRLFAACERASMY